MSRATMQRRTLMCLAVPAAALFGRRALAWREQAAGAQVARDWADRCRAVAPAAAGVAVGVGGPAVAICPFCGCPVSGARDHGEAGPLPPG